MIRRMISAALCALLSFSIAGSCSAEDDILCWGGFGRADNVYSHAVTDEKVIALTFDDGPHPHRTDEVLDILAEYGVKATFFVIGKNAESYPKKLKRIADEGHEIGNHTYSHLASGKADVSSLTKELKRTEKIIFDVTGEKPETFRPPTGYCNSVTLKSASDMNYKIIVWTVDTRDWAHNSKENIVRTVKEKVKNGAIILMHDFIAGISPTPDSLRVLIPYLLGEGYEFVTVSELISRE